MRSRKFGVSIAKRWNRIRSTRRRLTRKRRRR